VEIEITLDLVAQLADFRSSATRCTFRKAGRAISPLRPSRLTTRIGAGAFLDTPYDLWWRAWNKNVHGLYPADMRPEGFHHGGLVSTSREPAHA
jgi:hypothetical protein